MSFILQDYDTVVVTSSGNGNTQQYVLPFKALVSVEPFDFDRSNDRIDIITTNGTEPDYFFTYPNGNGAPLTGVFQVNDVFRIRSSDNQITGMRLHIFRLPTI